MDETPSYMDTSTQKPSKKKTIWLILIIVALIASNVSWALFFFKQQGELTTKNNILLAKVAKLEKENKDLESKSNQASADSEYREIPELGISYKIDDATEGATYAYLNYGDGVKTLYISTTALVETDHSQAEQYEGEEPCGVFDPPTAIYQSKDQTRVKEFTEVEGTGGSVKKVGDFYYAYTYSKLNSRNCDKELFQDAIDAGKAMYDSIKPVE